MVQLLTNSGRRYDPKIPKKVVNNESVIKLLFIHEKSRGRQ